MLAKLLKIQDKSYREFNAKLIPNSKPMIGCRIPQIKLLAKEVVKEKNYHTFLANIPHQYHDEDILHMLILNLLTDYQELIQYLKLFVPHITNWAVCDTFKFPKKMLKGYANEFYLFVQNCLNSKETYPLRFGYVMLLGSFIDDEHIHEIIEYTKLKSDSYYVNMAIAWLFQGIMLRYYEQGLLVLQERQLSRFVHNKAISKCIDSFRITAEQKIELKALRIK